MKNSQGVIIMIMVPQSYIKDCLKRYKISDEVLKFIEDTMKDWKVEQTSGGKSLA